jgi:signal transduction histidine kinase
LWLLKESTRVGVDALTALHDITAKIVASLDLDETLASIARAVCELLTCDIGAIYLIDEPANVLRLRGIYGQRSPAWEGHTMSLDRGMNAMAVRSGQVQRVDDYLSLPADQQAPTPVVQEEPMRAVITAPMTHRGRRLGSLGAVRREPSPFDDRDLVLLEMLADHASIAVANAIAFEQLETLRARETAQLREHAGRMAALEQAKTEFLQMASHELRGPISVIRGYLSMLYEGSLPPQMLSRILPTLMAKTQQVNLLVNEMLETARLEVGPVNLQLRQMDLRDVLRQAVERMQPLLPADSPIALKLPDRVVRVEVDPARIETVIANLLDNAVKYSTERIRVECVLNVNGSRATIEVRDQGVGIRAEDLPKLFQRFSRISSDETRAISGTGLGLYIARQLVRRHGGEITVTSRPGAGSVFAISLPLAEERTQFAGIA